MITQGSRAAFNFIWKIGGSRGFTKRFSEYLVVLLIGPMVVFAAIGLTASARSNHVVMDVMAIEPFGAVILFLTQDGALPADHRRARASSMPTSPNTRVQMKAAAHRGAVRRPGLAERQRRLRHLRRQQPNYKAIYSGFAIVIVLLLWIYVGWLIILMGCRLGLLCAISPGFLPGTAEAGAAVEPGGGVSWPCA